MLLDDQGLQERVARMESLLEEIENLRDPEARSRATEMVGVLLDLYGEGLARMMDTVAEGDDRERAFEAFASDELVSHLLLLHGLHPLGVEARVRAALDEVRPYLESHGGNVEFLGVEDGVARLRLEGNCDGCPSSAATLKLAIEEAVQRTAPDLEGIEAKGVAEPKLAPTLVAGPTLGRKPKKPDKQPETGTSWTAVGGTSLLPGAGLRVQEVAGEPVLLARVGEDLYAYRDSCPGCGGSLARGKLGGPELTCAGCGSRYDVRRAGRCLNSPRLHLAPIPLLVDGAGVVKIAAPGTVG